MQVIFLRHAEAEPQETTDAARRLTVKGENQARKVGAFLKASGIRPSLVLTSPLARARETAEIVTKEAGLPAPVVTDWLAIGMVASKCFAGCAEAGVDQESGGILLIGHEPDFGEAIGAWIGDGGSARLRIRKASITVLDVCAFAPGGACLEILLPARLLSHAS